MNPGRWLVGTLALVAAQTLGGTARADDAIQACLESYDRVQTLRKDRRLLEARREVVACSQPACPKEAQEDCATWLTEIERQLPSIVVTVKDAAGSDVLDGTLSLDGIAQPQDTRGVANEVDPGPHKLLVQRPGSVDVRLDLVIVEGEKARPIVVKLVAAVEKEGPPIAAESGLPAFPAFMLGGAGVAGIVVGAVLFALADEASANAVALGLAEVDCRQPSGASAAACQALEDEVDSENSLRGGSVAGLAIGGAALVTAAVYVALLATDDPVPPTAGSVRIVPVVGVVNGLTVVGCF